MNISCAEPVKRSLGEDASVDVVEHAWQVCLGVLAHQATNDGSFRAGSGGPHDCVNISRGPRVATIDLASAPAL